MSDVEENTMIFDSNPQVIGTISSEKEKASVSTLMKACARVRGEIIKMGRKNVVNCGTSNPNITLKPNGDCDIGRDNALPNSHEEKEAIAFLVSRFLNILAQKGYKPEDSSSIDFSCGWDDATEPYPQWDFEKWHADRSFAFVRFGATPIEFIKGRVIAEGLPEDIGGDGPEVHEATEAALNKGCATQHQAKEEEVLLFHEEDIHRKGKIEASGFRLTIRSDVKRILES